MTYEDEPHVSEMPVRPQVVATPTPRKPRIALMGEFSAGKSTLSNLLIGATPLPTKVTATQLPPVWISHGEGNLIREDLDGTTQEITLDDLAEVSPAETKLIRLFATADILELCDIIDMPGISDPNMDSDVWERVIDQADAVIWCTHATQAWRQSEAAVWGEMTPELQEKSLLLVTRFDKVLTENDRRRIMKRVTRETDGLFADRLPISLTQALVGRDDPQMWESSGAEAFTARFIELLQSLGAKLDTPPPERTQLHAIDDVPMQQPSHAPRVPSRPVLQVGGTRIERPQKVLPNRVRPTSYSRRPTPRPDGNTTLDF